MHFCSYERSLAYVFARKVAIPKPYKIAPNFDEFSVVGIWGKFWIDVLSLRGTLAWKISPETRASSKPAKVYKILKVFWQVLTQGQFHTKFRFQIIWWVIKVCVMSICIIQDIARYPTRSKLDQVRLNLNNF